MAIPVIRTKNEARQGISVNTINILTAPGIVEGDLILLCVAMDGNATSIIFPSGFVEIEEARGPSNRCTVATAFKIATDAEPGLYTISWTGNEQVIAEIYRIDGQDPGGGEVQDPDESNTGTSSTPTITPVASTDRDDSLVIVVMGMDDDDITVDGGGDADYSVEDVDRSNTGANTCSIGVQTKGIATAAVPPQCDLTLTASEEFAAVWFAIRSAAGEGPEVIHFRSLEGFSRP